MSEKISEHKFCNKCGIELIPNINWPSYAIKSCHYDCRDCITLQKRKEYLDNIDERRKQGRKRYIEKDGKGYHRKHTLCTSGKTHYGLNKRDYPINNSCELCNLKKGKLSYHHWDDTRLSVGIWVCWRCHCICESHEDKEAQPVLDKYIAFKKQLQN